MDTYVLPGGEYSSNLHQLFAEIGQSIKDSSPFPIKRFFDLLPINVVEQTAGEELIGRGDITPTISPSQSQADEKHIVGIADNSGDFIEVDFDDDALGRISIAFEDFIQLSFSLKENNSIEFQFNVTDVFVTIYDPPPEIPINREVKIKSIKYNEQGITFTLSSSTDIFSFFLDFSMWREDAEIAIRKYQRAGIQPLTEPVGPVIVMCLLTSVWCANQGGGEDDFENGDEPEPKEPDADFRLYPDCLHYNNDTTLVAAQFFRNPFWFGNDADRINKTAKVYFDGGCRYDIGDGWLPAGWHKLKIVSITSDESLVYKYAMFGEII